MKDKLQSDLKAAMLSGDKQRVSVLSMLKSAVLNQEIQLNIRDTGLDDAGVMAVFQKEAKKRLDVAEMYKNANDEAREAAERYEYDVIVSYLPTQITDDELVSVVNDQIAKIQPKGVKDMGKVISAVKAEVGNTADGARIATLVKEKIS